MEWNDETSVGELKTALGNEDRAKANQLVDALIASLDPQTGTPRKIPADTAKDVLSSLRAYTMFDRMFQAADRIMTEGQRDPQVRRQLSQALIENGQITTAIEELRDLRDELRERRGQPASPTEKDRIEFELGESVGLLGRAYKQLYVNAEPRSIEPRQADLDRAVENYRQAYQERLGDYMWHGVNLIALLTHAERVKKSDSKVSSKEAERHARDILDALKEEERKGPLNPWYAANRAEAYLALGDNPAAVDAVRVYLETQGLDAFTIQGTRRQFKEMWQLNGHEYPGREILPLMTARFAQLGGGRAETDLTTVDPGALEKIWGATEYKPIGWLLDAVSRARCVARLGPNVYEGWGTGFLLDGERIHGSWADRHLLLTNAHVCTEDPEVQRQYPYPKPVKENTAVFLAADGASGNAVPVGLIEQLWTSSPSELDATLIEIEKPTHEHTLPPIADAMPSADQGEKRVNILGHPRGYSLRVSIQDNQLVGVEDRYLHYRTPTDPGSSGSPIFDQEWSLVGLHHSSKGEKNCNEGIRMDRILERIRQEAL